MQKILASQFGKVEQENVVNDTNSTQGKTATKTPHGVNGVRQTSYDWFVTKFTILLSIVHNEI